MTEFMVMDVERVDEKDKPYCVRSSNKVSSSLSNARNTSEKHCAAVTRLATPKGGRGISDVSPLSEISGFSVSFHFSISPLVLLPSPVALSVLLKLFFSVFGPFS